MYIQLGINMFMIR